VSGNPKLLLAFGKCFPTADARRQQVEVLPQPSKIRREPSRYLKNDSATGKIRWLGNLVLAEIETVTHNVKTFRFKPPHGEHIPFSYLPGQFLTLHVAPRGILTTRSYTIASTPTWRDRIEITVKREEHGLVSRWLHDELRIGDEVQIEAPNGTFCFTGKQSESIVLIGGGVGMTPMMSAVRYLTETSWPGQVYLVLGFQAPRDFTFPERDRRAGIPQPQPQRQRHNEQTGKRTVVWSRRPPRCGTARLGGTRYCDSASAYMRTRR
jgi:ferredoxin-NADP reductase